MQEPAATTFGADRRSRLGPLYDAALGLLAREGRWRAALAQQIAPQPHDVVLDGVCGAGALCLTLARMEPRAEVIGLDRRPEMLAQARARAAEAGLRISFVEGDARDAGVFLGTRTPTQIALTLTSAPSAAARLSLLQGARSVIDPAGVLHAVDFGRQASAPMRAVFDLFGGPDPGDAMALMRAAGFVAVEETATWTTGSGVISLFRARAS